MNFNNANHAKFFENTAEVTDRADMPVDQVSSISFEAESNESEVFNDASDYPQDTVSREGVSAVVSDHSISDLPSGAVEVSTVSVDGFQTYVIPVASTDYKGLEAIDARLADRVWRLNNLYQVINEAGELVKFRLRPAQLELLAGIHNKNIVLKARQLGFTTFICLFLLDYALFNKNKQIGIIGPTQTDTTVIFRKVKVAWDNFPQSIKDFLRLNTAGDSKVEYEFTNGSVMRISTSLRSGTYQAVLITEFGKICARFPEKAEEIITGTLPAVPANGLVFIESTAEGEEGRFYEMVQDAMEAKRVKRALTIKDYKFFFFPWFQNPANRVPGNVPIPGDVQDYIDKVERLCKVVLTVEAKNWYYLEQRIQRNKMRQEHPSTPEEAFLTSGNKLFSGEVIDAQREKYLRDPIQVDGDFLIYKKFNKSHTYGLGADVSQGVKRDSSTIVIIDFTTGEIVLTYRSNSIDPVTFAHDIKKAALMFGGCIVAPEANNVGLTTCVQLSSIYTNIYTQVREGLLEPTATQKLGWLTTTLTKPKMMYELSEAIADDSLRVCDDGILSEAKKFNKEDSLNTQVNENTTRHFDLLTAAAIAWQMRAYVSRGVADPEDVAKVEERRHERATRRTHNYK